MSTVSRWCPPLKQLKWRRNHKRLRNRDKISPDSPRERPTLTEIKPTYILYVGNGSDDHREAVQAIVKEHAIAWWHYYPDIWIVTGHSHTYWADLVKPVLALSNAGFLTLELPRDQSQRHWSMRGTIPPGATKWLWESYFGKPDPKEAPKADLPAGKAAEKPDQD